MLMFYVYSKRKTPVTIEIDTVIKFNDMCFLITSRCVVTASTARAMSKTPKEMYAASSNAASSCGLCKSVGDPANCKNLFRKANRTLVVAVEEI